MAHSDTRRKRSLLAAALIALSATTVLVGPNAGLGKSLRASTGAFAPVPLPNPRIPGFRFPEPAATVVTWAKTNNAMSIDLHAWGIWTALTRLTNEMYNGQRLRVFETWVTPGDITETTSAAALARLSRNPDPVAPLEQFSHSLAVGAVANLGAVSSGPSGPEATVVGFVKYDPTAEAFIRLNGLLNTANLNALLSAGEAGVPSFPSTAIALKPVYLPVTHLVQGRYFMLKTWPGSPALTKDPQTGMYVSNDNKAFASSEWGQCIWIDVHPTGAPPPDEGTSVDRTCSVNGSSRTTANTYGVGSFINFQMSATQAQELNASAVAHKTQNPDAKAGDYEVLTAMHVATKEITRWTWQTFWWQPNPAMPLAPSTRAMVAARPSQLQGPARHYAGCAAYQELNPLEPVTGGSNTGQSVYCFNPYLEASAFGPNANKLPDSQPGMTTLSDGSSVMTPNDVGVQTNCMSCHEQANYHPGKIGSAPDYTGDRYVDLNDPAFRRTLQADFLWSIPLCRVPQARPPSC